MNYKDFDNNVSPFKYMYEELHKEILQVLQNRPLNIFELREVIKENGHLSDQLQFLKSRGEVINKRFQGVVFWAIPKECRVNPSKEA